ncbi:MAG TPA: helix-turn-helix domain-containing protein [Candidatus Dormibacteraeota bacterium]|nr:helix-turn-helix domain-containing protein [Candidatus Dormibacteraeota bacterium]
MPDAEQPRAEREPASGNVTAAVVEGLAQRLDLIVESVIAQVRRDVPEYRPPGADAALVEGIEQTVRRAVQMVLRLWREGRRNLTTGDRVVMGMIGSQRAEQGVSLESLLSSVRIARSVGWSHAVAVAERLGGAAETVTVLGDLASVLFDITDDVSDAITAGYDRVHETRVRARERTRSQVFEDLLNGSFGDDDEMVIRARTFGFDLRRPHGLILLTTVRADQDRSLLRAAVAALLPSIGNAAEISMSADVAPHMVLVVPSSSASWDEVLEATQRVSRQQRITAVVSAPVAGPRALQTAYRRAAELLPLAVTVYRRPHVAEAGDLVVYQILRGSRAEDRSDFLERTLGPILHLPEVQRSPLLDTLDSLHEGSGHTETAAAMLGVHTNTVRYRIGRIHHLTGLRYDHPPDRFKLEVATILLRMAGGLPGSDRSAIPLS